MKSLLTLLAITLISTLNAQNLPSIVLWPDSVPGEEQPKAKPTVQIDDEGDIERLLVVTNPVLEVFAPEAPNSHKGSILIFPGGGYSKLAIQKEGYEIAHWLNSLGYTAFVLQYRIPKKQEGALMDAQRAIRIVRSKAEELNIDPNKIGVLGFSAGASLAARASTRYVDQTYIPIDVVDSISSKPNFSILIYPAYLDQGENNSLTPELVVNEDTPPMFLYVAADDRYANSSLVMTQALREQKVLVELHVAPQGGHGFGLRKGNPAAEKWPGLAAEWLKDYVFR